MRGADHMTDQLAGFEVEHLHGPEEIPYAKDELVVVYLLRDGLPWIKSFVEHYSSIGVKHIVFLDNGSTDGTVDTCSRYDGVTVLRTRLPFNRQNQPIMRQYLFNRFGKGRWALCVDIDELFDYPYSDVLPLGSLLGYLNSKSYTAVAAHMLDMFPERLSPDRTHELVEGWQKEHRFYDISGVKKERLPEDKGLVRNNVFDSDEMTVSFHGGIREALFGHAPLLSKYPLMFSDGESEHVAPHKVVNTKIADFTCVLFHYKFYAFSLQEYWHKVIKQKDREKEPKRRRTYEAYMNVLEHNQGLQLRRETSREIGSVNDLVENRFLVVSEDYVDWVNAEDEKSLSRAPRSEPRALVEAQMESRRQEREQSLRARRSEQRADDLEQQQLGEQGQGAQQGSDRAQKPRGPERGQRRPDRDPGKRGQQRKRWSKILQRPGLRPRTVVDVGVGSGTPQLYEAFPKSFHVLVEPLREHEPGLQDILKQYEGKYVLTALGSSNRTSTITVEPGIHKSSFLERTALSATGAPSEKREVPMTTLDTLMVEHDLQPPFGLKIDSEGFELEIVKGASEFLRKTQFVVAEVSVAKRFVKGYSFSEFTEIMTRNGFFLWDVLTVREKYLDAVFVPSLNYQPTSLLLNNARLRTWNIVRTIRRRWA